ncbi:MAG: TM0106 family RecB-like putative nuclease [Microthrixaceae bacterium]
MVDRLLTPSKITAWLECAHYLSLRNMVDSGTLSVSAPFGSFAQLVVDKGLEHEGACLQHYRDQGLDVFEVPPRQDRESFAKWVQRVGNPLADGHDVIYQMPFVHDGIRGVADFLERIDESDGDGFRYEPVDSKLARSEAKVGHVLQLCFYAEAIAALTGLTPHGVRIWLGSGTSEGFNSTDVMPYWTRLRKQLVALLDEDHDDDATRPVRCTHCEFCEFQQHCEAQWRDEDSLQLVAGFRVSDLDRFRDSGIGTVLALAGSPEPVPGFAPWRLKRLVDQAALQVEQRSFGDDAAPPFSLIEVGDDPQWGHGFEQLPEPDDGDMFLDFEGHPMWRADAGLFFLFGYITRVGPAGVGPAEWTYTAMWAHDRPAEAARTHELIEFIADRRRHHPGMHVYHYNHTERSSLERLATEHGVAQSQLGKLIETGCFVDLFPVVRNSVQVGVESYGLKHVERLTGFKRSEDIHGGSGAVVDYDRWIHDQDPSRLERIADYNEDDVRATMALRDWLIEQRPAGLAWREASLEADPGPEGLDEKVDALKSHGEGTPEWLMGDVLGYWRREFLATIGPRVAMLDGDTEELLDHEEFVTSLEVVGKVERTKKNGTPAQPVMRFRYPDQEVMAELGSGTKSGVLYVLPAGGFAYGSLGRVDHDARELDLVWNPRAQEAGVLPVSIALNDWVDPGPKVTVIDNLAMQMLDPGTNGTPSALALALLRKDPPRFVPGHGAPDGGFSDDVNEIAGLVPHLDSSYLAVQGPPGTGKTYTGSHIVLRLLDAGLRVGITAFSHSAIDNLLEEVVDLIETGSHEPAAIVRRATKPEEPLSGVDYASTNKKAADEKYRLVAGTTWSFASEAMRANPVDVLLIDEAGQMSLADALSTTGAARNIVLLGDPLQLAQVAKASHPNGSGASVLEHVLDGHDTIPPDRGVFLHCTRRMHPDVSSFISERIYEGRLESHPTCAVQNTVEGTGLRWLEAEHSDCSTRSSEEADLIHDEIGRLIGTEWTNQHGEVRILGAGDFMVVAPYGRQVKCLQETLNADPRTRGVPVGTVDRFQGREAAIVFFSMTASDADEIPRGSAFLFSQNRLNVAISRARCIAYLVCTDALLDSRAGSVGELQLIANLCAFADTASSRWHA